MRFRVETVVLNDQGQVLLVVGSEGEESYTTLPGGGISNHGSLVKAARAEVLEEALVEIDNVVTLDIFHKGRAYRNAKEETYTRFCYSRYVGNSVVVNNRDMDTMKTMWVDYKEAYYNFNKSGHSSDVVRASAIWKAVVESADR